MIADLEHPGIKLMRMVSLSSTFQQKVGASSETEALKRVFFRDVFGEKERPFAVVRVGESHRWRKDSGGSQNWGRESGDVGLYLTVDTNPLHYDDKVQAEFDAENFFINVARDVWCLSGAEDDPNTGHLPITSAERIGFSESPQKTWESMGRFYTAVYLFSWEA